MSINTTLNFGPLALGKKTRQLDLRPPSLNEYYNKTSAPFSPMEKDRLKYSEILKEYGMDPGYARYAATANDVYEKASGGRSVWTPGWGSVDLDLLGSDKEAKVNWKF